MIFMQNDYSFCLLDWAFFWGVRLGLCFLGRIIFGRIILDGVAGALFFCHEKAVEFECADPCGGKVFVYFRAFL
jgi:hypothetical protein